MIKIFIIASLANTSFFPQIVSMNNNLASVLPYKNACIGQNKYLLSVDFGPCCK